jgi:hypothetical protein
LQRPFDESNPGQLIRVARRTEDDLPDRVKGTVLWRTDLPDRPPGYYHYDVQNNVHSSVEFIEDHWYWLYDHGSFTFVSLNDRIERNTYGTGFWAVEVDPQHPEHHLYIEEQIRNAERLGIQLILPEGYETGPSGAPALTVDTGVPTLSEDPTLSAFVAATATSSPSLLPGPSAAPAATATAVSSPAFTQSRHPSDQEESESSEATGNNSTTDDPSPEQEHPQEPVLEAQLEYGLDIQDREPENPLTPDQPAYQQLIEDAVAAGLNVPPPPPVVQPAAPPVAQPAAPQFPAPQPIVPAPIMAAAAPATTRLRGKEPDIFTGDRTKSETFKQQFRLYKELNKSNEVMDIPYYRVAYALTFLKGPLVQDWVQDQIDDLVEKTRPTRANHLAQNDEVLWTDFETAFDAMYTDTTKKQQAFNKLQHLHMRHDDLDGYVATFKKLAKDAGYTLQETGTTRLFALGLKSQLLDAILNRDTQPNTMIEWIDAAKLEQQKYANKQAMRNPNAMKYAWTQPQPRRNGNRRHPNDETVPMDVDPPVFTQIRRAHTEAQKDQYRSEGRCFECDRQGHMARDCPTKKKQAFQRPYQPDRQFRSNQRPPYQGDSRFKKKPFGQYNQQKPFNQPKRTQGFRKSNKPKYTPHARVASIQEVDEDDGYEDQEDEENVHSLAIRTARLSDEQREDWVAEMDKIGIHF